MSSGRICLGYFSNHSFSDLYTAGNSLNSLSTSSSPRYEEELGDKLPPHSLGFCANISLNMQDWKRGQGDG